MTPALSGAFSSGEARSSARGSARYAGNRRDHAHAARSSEGAGSTSQSVKKIARYSTSRRSCSFCIATASHCAAL
eukprot:3262058-Prymnesium_polylepis.3